MPTRMPLWNASSTAQRHSLDFCFALGDAEVSAEVGVATALDEQECPGSAVGAPRALGFQRRSPAVADIIGARLVWTAAMISSGSMPCR